MAAQKKKTQIFVELDHLRQINQLLMRQPTPEALLEGGKQIKEFSAELEPGLRAVIEVIFSRKGAWVRPRLFKNGKCIQELDPCFRFLDREYRFDSGSNQPNPSDHSVKILPGRYSHRDRRFVPIGKNARE